MMQPKGRVSVLVVSLWAKRQVRFSGLVASKQLFPDSICAYRWRSQADVGGQAFRYPDYQHPSIRRFRHQFAIDAAETQGPGILLFVRADLQDPISQRWRITAF